jgi:hypothetical protein
MSVSRVIECQDDSSVSSIKEMTFDGTTVVHHVAETVNSLSPLQKKIETKGKG